MRARPENVDPAALHGHAGHGGLDGLAQAEVGVGDDQLRAARPRAVKLRRSAVQNALAVANGEVEDLAAVVAAHPVANTAAWETTRRLTLDRFDVCREPCSGDVWRRCSC